MHLSMVNLIFQLHISVHKFKPTYKNLSLYEPHMEIKKKYTKKLRFLITIRHISRYLSDDLIQKSTQDQSIQSKSTQNLDKKRT